MSWWSYINGIITVSPMGRTQAEKRYILDTVLEHLPLVTGSERDMDVYTIQKNGFNYYCSHDEFMQRTNNLINDRYGFKSRKGSMNIQEEYILVVNGALRDREFEQTLKEFQKWLCRLAKRVSVENVLVEIGDYEKYIIVQNKRDVYSNMFEDPIWYSQNKNKEPNWCEYLMWDKAKKSDFPIMLAYKYFQDEENDKEAERRINYIGA